jgi:SNF2 family DNA or RNA helicase
MHARVQAAIAEKGLAKSGIVILDALLKLRQACCDPRLLKIAGTSARKAGSAKLERLLEMLTTMLEEGRTILLFSQFTSMLALIEVELNARRIAYALLTGETKDRAGPVAAFQSGRVKLFLVSLKAGGVGLNLTAADTVIHYDPWWNPAVENQATDRAHRIGQTKAVFVHRLTVENTIEEKMEVLKARKSALAEGILSGAGASALKMTEADVAALFAD